MRSFDRCLLACLGLVVLILPAGAFAEDESLEELLQQVGAEYAESYVAPFVHTFGPNLASNLFNTASIPWHGLTFGVGVKMTMAGLSDDDQSFRRVVSGVELSDYTSDYSGTGDIVMEGPTIFGNEDDLGTISFYSGGLLLARQETITGLVETSSVPMIVPEIYVGGIVGLKATLRYLPEVDLGDYGKTKFMGFGLQWSAKGLMPELPVDVMAGFFTQKLEVGDLLETDVSSYFVGASKDFALLTGYAGLALESSEMTVTYEFEELAEDVSFTVDGVQEKRSILGATRGLPGMKLNVEMAKGSVATYSAGVMFGI